MMDLSILVFFQRWLIDNKHEMKHYRNEDTREGDLERHPLQKVLSQIDC